MSNPLWSNIIDNNSLSYLRAGPWFDTNVKHFCAWSIASSDHDSKQSFFFGWKW